jgi:hypothetical protein
VKSIRTFLLLLLVLLLPLRGAVAATMPCVTTGETSHATAALHDHGGGHADHSGHDMHADLGEHDQGAAPQHDGDGQNGHAERCHLCASGCHATPLATAPPEVAEPRLAARLVFPALRVAAPAFQSDGQERPPRSI